MKEVFVYVSTKRADHKNSSKSTFSDASVGSENTTILLHFWMLNIVGKCVSNRLELWVWDAKLSLSQVRTDTKKQVLTKLDASTAFWSHSKYCVWKWNIGQKFPIFNICCDVKWPILDLHQYKKNWGIKYCRSVSEFKIKWKDWELTNLTPLAARPIFEGGVGSIFEISRIFTFWCFWKML